MMRGDVVFRRVVAEASESGMPLDIKIPPLNLVTAIKIAHLHWVGAVFFTVSFAIPTDVALLQWMGVGGCGCSIYANVSFNTRPSLMFKNNAPNSASAAEDATNFRTVHKL